MQTFRKTSRSAMQKRTGHIVDVSKICGRRRTSNLEHCSISSQLEYSMLSGADVIASSRFT